MDSGSWTGPAIHRDDAKVKVTSGWSRDHKCDTTDIIVTHRAKDGKEHLHIVFDDYGNIIHESWTGDRTIMKHSTDLQTLPELRDYLKACIALEKTKTWPEIGARIMCIIGNNHYDEWYENYFTFQALFDLAYTIEAWPAYGLRRSDWLELKKLVNRFAQEVDAIEKMK